MNKLECKQLAANLEKQIKEETEIFVSEGNRAPSLAVLLVGNNPASETYVRKKNEICDRLGFLHYQYTFPPEVSEEKIISKIKELNSDDTIDGILVQLPLPKSIDSKKVIDSINPLKDVDGFSVTTSGLLFQAREGIKPCTPLGIMEILKNWNIPIEGKTATVIGRSNIVGRPVSAMLVNANATVTLCHSKTPKDILKAQCLLSDIIIVATGCPNTIDASFVKDGATVIDVGINKIEDSSREKGFRLVGDFDRESALSRDINVTPVPGGVGLMTVVCLAKNTLQCAKNRQKEKRF